MNEFSKFFPDEDLEQLFAKPSRNPFLRLQTRSQSRLCQILTDSKASDPSESINNLHLSLHMLPDPDFFGN